MADREKVIRGLEQCVKGDGKYCLLGCPYFQNTETTKCFEVVAQDALELLKEQQAEIQKAHEEGFHDGYKQAMSEMKAQQPKEMVEFLNEVYCPRCRRKLKKFFNYCNACGQAVIYTKNA